MLSLRITLFACLLSFSLIGQELIFQESFESDNEGITYVSNSFESGCSFFGRQNSPPDNGCFFEAITGLDGSTMWAAKDVNETSEESTITFEPISISAYENLFTTIKLGVTRDGLFGYPSLERIYIEYSIDNEPYELCGLVIGNGVEFGNMAIDLDLDPNTLGPFGTELTDAMQDLPFTIPGTGNELRIRLRVIQFFSTSEFGIDDVRVSGDISPFGCFNPSIFIPEVLNSAPAIFGCGYPPPGYIIPNQDCALQVAEDDPYCLTDFWDVICQNAYEELCFGCANAGCTDPLACNFDPAALCDDESCIINDQYYIPIVPGGGPLVIACEAPAGYVLASRNCAMAIAELDPFCLVDTWDFICQNQYIDCLQGEFSAYGCTYPEAINYSASSLVDDGSCFFFPVVPCPADIDGNGIINSGDLAALLSEFGNTCGIVILQQGQ